MQFRVVRTKYKGSVHLYGQIVESYRRESDGMPTHGVVQALGELSPVQAANLKTAFDASRNGHRVCVVDPEVLARSIPVPLWTRDLVAICAVRQALKDFGLHQVLREVFAGHDEEVEPADMVAALVAQRCVAPASKLAACRWFSDTVLPELLGISPAQFHNTRLHRVLDRLESVESNLQNNMINKMLQADGKQCTAFFIDCERCPTTSRSPARTNACHVQF